MYNRKIVFAAACLGMLVFGMLMATLGSILPSVIERFGIDKANAGSLFLLMALGVLVGSLFFGPVVDRYGYKGLLVLSMLMIVAGMESMAFAPSLAWLRAAVLVVGLGGGVVNGATAALVADIYGAGERGSRLSLQGVFFGLGAVGVPFVLGMLLDVFALSSLIAGMGLLVLIPLAFTAAIRLPVPKHAQGFPLREGIRLTGDRVMILLGLVLLLESGMEATVGGWVAAFYQERLGLAEGNALLFLALYWLGLMLMRMVVGTVLRRASPAAVLPASIGLALVGSLLMISARSLPLAIAGTFLTGAGFGAVFPLVLGYIGDRFAAISGTAFSVAMVMAQAGGMLLPYLTGVLGESFGLGAALLLVPASLLVQLTLLARVKRER